MACESIRSGYLPYAPTCAEAGLPEVFFPCDERMKTEARQAPACLPAWHESHVARGAIAKAVE